MNAFVKTLLRVGGVFCLIGWLLPFAVYRIFNAGTMALLLVGVVMLLLPCLWVTVLAPVPGARRAVAVLGCLVFAFCLAVSALIARRAWFHLPPEEGRMAVVVLGSRVNGDRPSLMLWRRLYAAAGYLERNPDAVCVVSGGQGPDEDYPEALVMRDTLVNEMGVEGSRVIMEDRSSSTRQNLRYSRTLLEEAGWRSGDGVVLVTDSFHQLRASVYASAEGLGNSYNLSSLTPWGLMPSYWVREILGVSWAWLTLALGIG